MKNIAIIESYTDDSRIPKWGAIKTKFGKSYKFHPVEQEVEAFINSIPDKSLFILFAHLGDTQDYNEALFEKCSSNNVVLIQYTGGVSQYKISANSIENIHFNMLMDNIDIFLIHCKKLISITEADLGLLIAIDPKLEELLEPFKFISPFAKLSDKITLEDGTETTVAYAKDKLHNYLGIKK